MICSLLGIFEESLMMDEEAFEASVRIRVMANT